MIGNKGSMMDYFYFLLVFTFIGIMFIIGIYLWDQISSPLNDIFGSGSEGVRVMTNVDYGFNIIDYLFLFSYFIFSILPIFLAVLVRTHPIFLVINIILLVIYFLIVPSISNIVYEFWSRPEFAVYAAGGGASHTFPIMTAIFQHLPLISFGLSFMLIVAQFAKSRGGSYE